MTEAMAHSGAYRVTRSGGLDSMMPERKLPTTKAQPAKKQRRRLRAVDNQSDVLDVPQVPMHYTECRALGHAWQHHGMANEQETGFRRPYYIEGNSLAFVSSCANCGTTRTKYIGRSGTLFPAIYRYPDGYQRKGEEERMSNLEWRRAWVVNAIRTER
jgi:hypothetical protein